MDERKREGMRTCTVVVHGFLGISFGSAKQMGQPPIT